jgi:hypothetical protein
MITNRLFSLKSLPFLALFFWLVNYSQAQVTDTIYQKPELNQGLPPAEQTPVIITPPATEFPRTETKEKVKVKTKEESEEKEDQGFGKRYFTGGSGSLTFGDYTLIQVAPIIGYQLTDRFAFGTGLSYMYINDRFENDASILGGKLFVQAMVYKGFFAHGEYELLDFKNNFPALLAGAGYRQFLGEKSALDMMLLFDLNQNTRSYYTNPIFRTGFIFYLN